MKTHREFMLLLALLVIVGIQEGPQWASAQSLGKSSIPSKNLRISAVVKKGETKGSIILEWSLANVSRRDIYFRDTYVLRDYKFIITEVDGHIVSPTAEGQQKINASLFVSHRDSVTLHPGEQVKRQLILTDIYELKPGRLYSVFLERHLSFDKGKTFEDVRSNVVRTRVDK
jgi:hypothetical protein